MLMNKEQIREKLMYLRDELHINLTKVAKDLDISASYLNLLVNNKAHFKMSDEMIEKIQNWIEDKGLMK